MKVWSLEACNDYEGCSLIGVYGTLDEVEKAKEAEEWKPHRWNVQDWEIPEVTGNEQ